MRSRAILLTLAVILIIALTAVVPNSWQGVKALNGAYIPSYGYYLNYLPFIAGGRDEVCIPVQEVEISGPNTGFADTTYTFGTQITPSDLTFPLEYIWDNGDATATSSRSFDVGTHTIMVTVCNCDNDCVSANHTIEIHYP
jgi:hypothetical protein